MLSCRTQLVWSLLTDRQLPNQVLNFLSLRNSLICIGRFPLNPALWMSCKIPCLHVISYAFSRSTRIDTMCSPSANAFLTSLSNRTKQSIVLLFFRHPHWIPVNTFLIFKYSSNLHWSCARTPCISSLLVLMVCSLLIRCGFFLISVSVLQVLSLTDRESKLLCNTC